MQEQQNQASVSDTAVLVSHQLTPACQLLQRQRAAGDGRPWAEVAAILEKAEIQTPFFLPTKAGRDQRETSSDNILPCSCHPNHNFHCECCIQTPAVHQPISSNPPGKRFFHHEKSGLPAVLAEGPPVVLIRAQRSPGPHCAKAIQKAACFKLGHQCCKGLLHSSFTEILLIRT